MCKPISNSNYSRKSDLKRLRFVTEVLKLNSEPKGRVLDVGCGNGNISLYLGEIGYQVLGIDISAAAIDKARESNSYENVTFQVQDAETLSAQGQTFDAVICSEVLEHLEQPQHLVDQISNLLKTDGVLIVTVPNGRGPREMFMTKPMQYIKNNHDDFWQVTLKFKKMMGFTGETVQSAADNLEHILFFSKKELLALCRNFNFELFEFEKVDFIQDVFPFSLIAKRIGVMQQLDCNIADLLPAQMTSGFHSAWVKK